MNSVAPSSMAKRETQAILPPYDSLPPPPYTFNYVSHHQTSSARGVYYQQYPLPARCQASSGSSHFYPPGASYPSQPPQVEVIVVGERTHWKPVQSFIGHVALACFVTFCCNPLFGLISFILAILAQNVASNGNGDEARRLGNASLGLSFAGIFVMTIITMVLLGIALA